MNGSPSVKVALFIRNGGSESPCRWFYVTGIYNDLRHTFAVISLENGDDVKTVQQNLGHSTASFTLDVYGHVSDRMRKESAARMDQFINNVSSPGTDFN